MQLGGDERGVSEVLGAILVFGILVTALGVYQSVAVPNANEDVELKHNQEVQGDMIDLRNDIRRSASQGTGTSTTLNLGASYPPRIIATNPGSGAGSFRVDDSGQIFVRDASSPDDDVGDFWDGSDKDYDTSSVVFSPNYNYFRNAPETRIEGATVYNSFEDGDPIPLSGQNVVDGREISLVTLEGDLSRSQATALSVDVDPVSVDESTVTLEADGSDDFVNVTIPTRGTESLWTEQLLSGQFDGPSASECSSITPSDGDEDDGYIKCYEWDDSGSPNLLTLTMEPGTTYELKVARVRVGSTSAGQQSPEYIAITDGDGITIPEDGRRDIVLEVRDRYDNPIANTKVNVSLNVSKGELIAAGQSGRTLTNVPTNDDGKLILTYEAPADTDTSPLPVGIETSIVGEPDVDYDDSAPENATAEVRVINASKIDRSAPLFNSPSGLRIKSATIGDANCQGLGAGKSCEVDLTLETSGEDISINKFRYVFYSADSQGFSGDDSPAFVRLTSVSPPEDYDVSGEFVAVPGSPTADPETTLTLEFYEDNNQGLEVKETDFFVISVITDEGVRETFFVSPTDN